MSWYSKAMALDPNAWETDPNPHRIRDDSPVVWTPYGRIHQKVDTSEIASKYTGVHFTDSIEYAAVYANNKSSKDDPPVIIKIDPTGFERLPDVDATADTSLDDYIHEMWQSTWADIIHSKTSVEEKADEIISSIQSDVEFGREYGDVIDNVVDYVQETFKNLAPQVILNTFDNRTDEEIIKMIINWVKNGSPPELRIAITRQFRVMNRIESNRVVAIYQIERFSEDLSQMSLEGDEYDDEGRRVLDYETFDYGWPDLKTIYKNPNPPSGHDPVFHGTSYKRAKQAFQDLLP